jgi:hypothetical protein
MSNVHGPGGGDNPFQKLGLLAALARMPGFEKLSPDLRDKLMAALTGEDLDAAEAMLNQMVKSEENAVDPKVQTQVKTWISAGRAWLQSHSSEKDAPSLGSDFLTQLLQRLFSEAQPESAGPAAPPPDPNHPICPVLAAFGLKGKVQVGDFQRILKEKGFSDDAIRLLTPIAEASGTPAQLPANFATGTFNIAELPGGLEKHPGDSMILSKGVFDPAKFANLETFAVTDADGQKVMTAETFAKFIASNVKRDVEAARAAGAPANEIDAILRGGNASAVEFGALLASFGKAGAGGQTLHVEDLRVFYRDHVFPPGMSKDGKAAGDPTLPNIIKTAGDITKGYIGAGVADILLQTGTCTAGGLARYSVESVVGRITDQTDAQIAPLLGQALGLSSGCPVLNGSMPMPMQAQQPGGLADIHGPNATSSTTPATAPDWESVNVPP